jgi:Glycosyltransferase WbsX
MSRESLLKKIYRRIKPRGLGQREASESFVLTEAERLSLALCESLFDSKWYLGAYSDVSKSGMNAWSHYVRMGINWGCRPNPLFDTTWYLQQNPDVAFRGQNPLEHYVSQGAAQGRNPNPLFDNDWYRRQNPEVGEKSLNPLAHYLARGWRDGRDPGPNFDTAKYVQEHEIPDGMIPLAHYLLHPSISVPPALLADSEALALRRQCSYFMNPGPGFEQVDSSIIGGARPSAKVIAYYLPQFHQIPENDQWWGTGFTEWRNVTRAQQRFLGHYQPRLPRDLGFYDLNMPGIQERQVQLAKGAGVFGFCFYYYFFDGRKILDGPVENFVSNEKIDFPFCLLWANENWCRRWDGCDDTVLLRQSHDPAFEPQLIDDLARLFSHPNYIRVNDRPLFFLYRPDVLPDNVATVGRWRELFQRRHNMNPFILMCQTFNRFDPRLFGFDGALEFPPHKYIETARSMENIRALDPDYTGHVYDYSQLVWSSLAQAPEYDLIRTVTPSWDNEARRTNSSAIFHGSTPQLYEDWLRKIIERSLSNPFHGESFAFINAWNEWAEGAYLEPDIHWGGAYLNATARAIASSAR